MIDEVSPIDLRTESAVVLGSLSKGTDENINSIVDAGCVSVLLKGQYQSNYYFLNLILHFSPTPFLQYTCYSVTCIHLHIAHKCMIQSNTHWKGNVLFNDALNTFYLRLYGIRHMVKDHSDSERGNPLPPHVLKFLIGSKGSFICIIPQTG